MTRSLRLISANMVSKKFSPSSLLGLRETPQKVFTAIDTYPISPYPIKRYSPHSHFSMFMVLVSKQSLSWSLDRSSFRRKACIPYPIIIVNTIWGSRFCFTITLVHNRSMGIFKNISVSNGSNNSGQLIRPNLHTSKQYAYLILMSKS